MGFLNIIGQAKRRTDKKTDRQKDGQTKRRTDKKTDRQKDGQTKRRTEKMTDNTDCYFIILDYCFTKYQAIYF